nr:hypothetical protein GCM10020093_061040 [Planobispora longispora]
MAGGYGHSGTPAVEQNADALWSTLVCKPWLMGQFGTADANAPVIGDFGSKLLDIQAIDAAEQKAAQLPSSSAHQARYEEEVAQYLKTTPIYFLFQGKDWTSRLGIAIGALMAAMVAGVLIFLVAVSLLALKIGFLLLLILAPVFLLIGVHPGSGRIIAMRWVEMLIGTLLRQAVLALVLGVLVYGYALIISTAMPWGMQVMFMALLTIAVFFYRRPFQHLFASMDGHTFTTRMLGEAASAPTLQRAAGVLPPVAAARVGRWGMRKAEPMLQAAALAGGASAGAAAAVAQGRARGEEGGSAGTPSGTRVPVTAQPAPLDTDAASGGRRKNVGRPVTAPRTGAAPPLNLSGNRTAGGSGGRAAGAVPRPGRAARAPRAGPAAGSAAGPAAAGPLRASPDPAGPPRRPPPAARAAPPPARPVHGVRAGASSVAAVRVARRAAVRGAPGPAAPPVRPVREARAGASSAAVRGVRLVRAVRLAPPVRGAQVAAFSAAAAAVRAARRGAPRPVAPGTRAAPPRRLRSG